MHVFSNRSSIVTVRSFPLFIVTRSVRTNHEEDEDEEDDDVLRRSSRDKTIGPTFSSAAVKDDAFDAFDVVSVSEPVVVLVVSDEVSFVATETSPSSSSSSFTLSPLASPRRRRLCPMTTDDDRRRPRLHRRRLHRPRRSKNASRRSRSDDDSTDRPGLDPHPNVPYWRVMTRQS